MPTLPDIGIDVEAIAAPLVDLGFGLAGTARVSGSLHLIGARSLNPVTDAMAETGGLVLNDLPAIMWGTSVSDATDADVRESQLMLNASDLVAKGAPVGTQPKINDKFTIGTVVWTIYELLPVPTDTIFMLRVRR